MELKPVEIVALSRIFAKLEKELKSREAVEVGAYHVKCGVQVDSTLTVKEDTFRAKEDRVDWKKLALALAEQVSSDTLSEVLKSKYADRELTSFSKHIQTTYESIANPRKETVKGAVTIATQTVEKVSNGTHKA